MSIQQSSEDAQAIEDTRRWVQRAVIGLNLCPFAKAVEVKQQVRYVVSPARKIKAALADLQRELLALAEADPGQLDTTLLLLPYGFADFMEYVHLLERADGLLQELELDGVLQIASLHPQYQFDDTEPEDLGNNTNRSPYPTLHLLREASVSRAIAAFANPEKIFETNIRTMQQLGRAGWEAMGVCASKLPDDAP